jgi:hypothetical protein
VFFTIRDSRQGVQLLDRGTAHIREKKGLITHYIRDFIISNMHNLEGESEREREKRILFLDNTSRTGLLSPHQLRPNSH